MEKPKKGWGQEDLGDHCVIRSMFHTSIIRVKVNQDPSRSMSKKGPKRGTQQGGEGTTKTLSERNQFVIILNGAKIKSSTRPASPVSKKKKKHKMKGEEKIPEKASKGRRLRTNTTV